MTAREKLQQIMAGYGGERLAADLEELAELMDAEAQPADGTQQGGIDEFGYVWCDCGEEACHTGKAWVCPASKCEFHLPDTGQTGLVRP